MKNYGLITTLFVLTFFSCQPASEVPQEKNTVTKPLFARIDASRTGVNFRNDLSYNEDFNIFTYRNFYNGGGVGIGDINNDGLPDIYLVANQDSNHLYLNKGDFQFEDITKKAGVAGERSWSTGVSMADVNGDGLLDIYVCNSGDVKGDNKQNELYINNGDLTFTESAAKYGLADRGFSTHAAFFDYDKDGDLDVYLLNNSYQAIGSFNLMQNKRPERDSVGGDKLYRNDGGHFKDVSEDAGIYGSIIGFGLGVSVGDVNNDGWPDIFVSNDFFERDYLYINNGDGTFSEKLTESMPSISAASMGADMADVNNDGNLDIFVTDMLPESMERLKQVTTFENWDKLAYNVRNGYYYQYTRNMLHLNNGDGTFSEVGRLANVSATDWSWGALFFDMDNDGKKDIFVANGIYQDLTDLDYLNFINDDETKKNVITPNGVNYKGLIEPMPVNPVANYAFKNEGDLRFTNVADQWGLGEPVHSNGSAYGDLDNDGDLDLVINNVNATASVFQNNATDDLPNNHYLRIRLKGKGMNSQAVGTHIWAMLPEDTIYVEQMPIRGFESSVDAVVNLGLGSNASIPVVRVVWPDNTMTELKEVKADTTLSLSWVDARMTYSFEKKETATYFHATHTKIPYKHQENDFVDFDRERLIYHMMSNEGPGSCSGDVNGDGLTDIFVGGAKDSPGTLLIQQEDGNYIRSDQEAFTQTAKSEDTGAAFLDADNDGDLDLVVASGGNEFSYADPSLKNHLYLNEAGRFTLAATAVGTSAEVTSVVVPIDINGDGAIDLFFGSRLIPFRYGLPASSHLMINDGTGKFTDHTSELAPELENIGMVTAATATDVDGDGDTDLVVVGEYMAPVILMNEEGHLVKQNNELMAHRGWYHSLCAADLDNDGDMDFILGNQGTNSKFKATQEHPIYLYISDFDQNGAYEQIMARKNEAGDIYPYTLKHDLEMQMPVLKKKYLKYSDYNDQTMDQIFTKDQLAEATVMMANDLETSVLINEGNGRWSVKALPVMAQFTPVYAIHSTDINNDGNKDLVLGGNLYRTKPEAGRYDASYGVVLINRGGMNFEQIPNVKSGLKVTGEVRQITETEDNGQRHLYFIMNNDSIHAYRF